ncbi:LytTR family DNA-binding domain-containing protein [Ahrensia sp. R2A130]|uniref:LytTR family DNA-binding domain-containing protein n=1 Tax=Ahrensia sp. R2A130 TaxID=744979 RepID=UPI0018DD01AD|nr:LytTR family DNA-binding domain-containing protein [Ahrensia sp. R2A130]
MGISKTTLLRESVAVLIITGLFTITGAFASGRDFAALPRFFYWLIIVAAAGASFHIAIHLLLRRGLHSLRDRAIRIAAGAFLGSFAPAIVIIIMERTVRPESGSEGWFIWLTTWVIGTTICFVRFMPPAWQVANLKETRTVEPDRIPFLHRLPRDAGFDLVSVSAEDHYLRVVTADGTATIKLPFATAITELKNYPGERIHRSHWVATSSVHSLDRSGRSHTVRLENGDSLPVSSTYLDRAATMVEIDRS